MAREFLIFRLWGPMASWGDIAVGERRGSWGRPSRSAILGLVAAALGIERRETAKHQELEDGLGFAVRVDDPGRPLRDFHTAEFPVQAALKDVPTATRKDHVAAMEAFNRTAPKTARGNPIISKRQYYVEMDAVIVLWAREGKATPALAQIATAFAEPAFTLYLGRKSCPSGLPMKSHLIAAETPLAALDAYDQQSGEERREGPDITWGRPKPRKGSSAADWQGDVWIGEDDARFFSLPMPYRERTSRRDGVRDRDRWLFSDRAEVRVAARRSNAGETEAAS